MSEPKASEATSAVSSSASSLQHRRRRILLVAGIVVVPLVALAVAYLVFFNDDSPDKFSLSNPKTPATAASTDLTGKWTMASGSQVGYRVREKLASLPAKSDAVGRTSDVTGGFTVARSGPRLVAREGRFQADLTTLKSGNDRRDGRIRSQGLESDRFPKATFVSTGDATVPAAAQSGGKAQVLVKGELTLHGITKTVAMPLVAQVADNKVELAGSLKFPMGDFAIDPPSIGGFVTVDDEATLEVHLFLQKS